MGPVPGLKLPTFTKIAIFGEVYRTTTIPRTLCALINAAMLINRTELHGRYVIDGKRTEASPFQMLEAASCRPVQRTEEEPAELVHDETVDPAPADLVTDASLIQHYLGMVRGAVHSGLSDTEGLVPLAYPAALTRAMLCDSLLQTIWLRGHFALEDLCVSLRMGCDRTQVGARAALWSAVEAACDYLECLGTRLRSYSLSCSETGATCLKEAWRVGIGHKDAGDPDGDLYETDPFTSGGLLPDEEASAGARAPRLGRSRKCPSAMVGRPEDWIIYIPFDTCAYKLGGSLLAKAAGRGGGAAPDILDPDYFMDCYEVVRELVEDGIVLSGTTVGRGGLALALDKFRGDTPFEADISPILQSAPGMDPVKVLFGEVPGVLVEIRDSDYDYLDAELLLQDVAYYPVGHPSPASNAPVGLTIRHTLSSLGGILQSLLSSQASEGED